MLALPPFSDIDGDYVHVTDTMTLDAPTVTSSSSRSSSNSGDSSPFVHVKKGPAVVSDGDGDLSSPTVSGAGKAEMDVDDVWGGDSATTASSGGATLVSSFASASSPGDANAGGGSSVVEPEGGAAAKGKGKEEEEEEGEVVEDALPYKVFVTDYSGSTTSATKGIGAEVTIVLEATFLAKDRGTLDHLYGQATSRYLEVYIFLFSFFYSCNLNSRVCNTYIPRASGPRRQDLPPCTPCLVSFSLFRTPPFLSSS